MKIYITSPSSDKRTVYVAYAEAGKFISEDHLYDIFRQFELWEIPKKRKAVMKWAVEITAGDGESNLYVFRTKHEVKRYIDNIWKMKNGYCARRIKLVEPLTVHWLL